MSEGPTNGNENDEAEQRNHTFRLRYKVEAFEGGFSYEDAKAYADMNYGACDALFLAPATIRSTGEVDMNFVGVEVLNGVSQAMQPGAMWQVWAMLAATLASDETLEASKRDMCRQVHEAIVKSTQQVRDKPRIIQP